MMKVLLALMAVATISQLTTATKYTVGAPSGSWDLNTNLTQWVSSSTFHLGDDLTFNYISSAHDVLEVTKADHDSCTTSSPISTDTSGNTMVSLDTVGTRYFICGFPKHSLGGIKVAIHAVCRARTQRRARRRGNNVASPVCNGSPGSSSGVGFGLGFGLAVLLVFLSI